MFHQQYWFILKAVAGSVNRETVPIESNQGGIKPSLGRASAGIGDFWTFIKGDQPRPAD
jgi:hypothetical protein